MASASEAIIKALGEYLQVKIPSLSKVHLEFPAPSQELVSPSVTILQGKPQLRPMDHFVIAKGAKIATGDDTGKWPVTRVVGQYEFNLQLDLWCGLKPQRHEMFDKIFQAFHQTNVSGISLQLADYFNVWARYEIRDYDFGTDQLESQRNEWRVRFSVVANCYAVTQTNEFLAEEIENTLETPATIAFIPEAPGDLII